MGGDSSKAGPANVVALTRWLKARRIQRRVGQRSDSDHPTTATDAPVRLQLGPRGAANDSGPRFHPWRYSGQIWTLRPVLSFSYELLPSPTIKSTVSPIENGKPVAPKVAVFP
jgi:hypothetical protein